jgi:hypothetical protein
VLGSTTANMITNRECFSKESCLKEHISKSLKKLKTFFYLVCEAIGTAATPGLLCQPRVVVKMIVEKQMECRLGGETEVLGENMPQRHFCPSQNTTWPHPGLNPGRRCGKPATNRLSYGAGNWRLSKRSLHTSSLDNARVTKRPMTATKITFKSCPRIKYEIFRNTISVEMENVTALVRVPRKGKDMQN